MRIHDWTRVPPGIFYDFHNAWITELRNWLNSGELPADYYAVGEQRAGDFGPDVLALHANQFAEDARTNLPSRIDDGGTIAVLQAPPRVETTDELKCDLLFYAEKQRQISIRHVSGDELVAFIEIVSPANKHSNRDFEPFLKKLVAASRQHVHLLVIDLFPPGPMDPHGIHSEFAEAVGDDPKPKLLRGTKNRGLYAYDTSSMKAYLQSLAVGELLIFMPLFLRPGEYVNIDLATTYQRAYQFFPARFKTVLES